MLDKCVCVVAEFCCAVYDDVVCVEVEVCDVLVEVVGFDVVEVGSCRFTGDDFDPASVLVHVVGDSVFVGEDVVDGDRVVVAAEVEVLVWPVEVAVDDDGVFVELFDVVSDVDSRSGFPDSAFTAKH